MNEMARIVPLRAESQKARITTAQFLRMCDAGVFDDDDWKIELVEGELERMPPPQGVHSLLQGAIYAKLLQVFGAERTRVEIGIALTDGTVFGCDVAVMQAPLSQDRWPRAEEVLLAVEVSQTTLARDLGMKGPHYAAAGIGHYWVVDGAASVVHAFHEPVGARFSRSQIIRFGEPLNVPGSEATIML